MKIIRPSLAVIRAVALRYFVFPIWIGGPWTWAPLHAQSPADTTPVQVFQLINSINVLLLQRGYTRQTGFEGQQIDKIIIRDAFHHFRRKEKMLRSIKASLRPGGEVIILEADKNEFTEEHIPCPRLLPAAELIRSLDAENFILLEKDKIGKYWLYRWQKGY